MDFACERRIAYVTIVAKLSRIRVVVFLVLAEPAAAPADGYHAPCRVEP